MYAVPDNAFSPSRIWTLQLGRMARVTSALTITKGGEPGGYDLEGIAMRPQGGWWVVSEGGEDFGAAELTKNLLWSVRESSIRIWTHHCAKFRDRGLSLIYR